ncbi:MAG: glycosyltransferase family 4 protein [Chloroflexota bacterium]|nr:glycosyltransferase family 4 protein [Chloroflexota bacterium]
MTEAPLRVLFLTPYFRPYLGGIERAIEQLTFQIQESQQVEAVAVLTTKYAFPRVPHPEWADRETTEEGIEIYRLKGFPKRSIPLYSCPLVWFSPIQVRSFLKEFNPDVVHFVGDGWFWGHFWSWFWYHSRARFVFTPSYHKLPLIRWWLRPINAFICNVVDNVIALTSQEANLVRRDYLVPRKKLGIIGWGAPAPENPVLPEPPGEGEPITLLCVGRLGRHKGQEWLLGVYSRARIRFERPVKLVLVGRDEGDEEKITAVIQDSGLGEEVAIVGEVSDQELADWYAKADVFVLFSHYEAFGLVFFEAMAWGTPVLTHDVGANRELLTRGAVVVERFDEDESVDELVRFVNDGGHRQRLAEDAQDYALSEFTWPAVAGKYLGIYADTSL